MSGDDRDTAIQYLEESLPLTRVVRSDANLPLISAALRTLWDSGRNPPLTYGLAAWKKFDRLLSTVRERDELAHGSSFFFLLDDVR